MPQLSGVIEAEGGASAYEVGAFAGPRIQGHPADWTMIDRPGPFTLEVPDGTWYIHAVASAGRGEAFASAVAFGSHGGIYGYGRPVTVAGAPMEGLVVAVSPLWSDLTYGPSQVQLGITDAQSAIVHTVMDTLSTNLRCKVEEDLGPVAGLTRTRLTALFKRTTGLTPAEYRTRLRLEAAKALLVESDLDVLDVAFEVGYESPAQLGRMFARHVGVSPAEFRRLARSGGCAPPEESGRSGVDALLQSALLRLRRRGATIHGEVSYTGRQRGAIIYVGAFADPYPVRYPLAWTALPAPGPYTLRHVPPGSHYLLACYCHRRMRYPGDIGSAFAGGRFGFPPEPTPVTICADERLDNMTITMADSDLAARTARPWWNNFLPDGR